MPLQDALKAEQEFAVPRQEVRAAVNTVTEVARVHLGELVDQAERLHTVERLDEAVPLQRREFR